MPRTPYSEYKLCVCSHMRLVCYTDGKPYTYKLSDGEHTRPAGPVGWYHISPDGTLENFGDPCEASIHRFDFEWPENATVLGNMLWEPHDDGGSRPEPSPSSKTMYERHGHEAKSD